MPNAFVSPVETAGERDRMKHDHSGNMLVSAGVLHRTDHVNRRAVRDLYVDICASADDGCERDRQIGSKFIERPSFNLEPPKKRDRNRAVLLDRVVATQIHALIKRPQSALRIRPILAALLHGRHIQCLVK
jgi:DNA mismatch repair protein MutH